jgi:mannose-1-phosphate guanylyltransferase/mannose-6-phosphate isomerase
VKVIILAGGSGTRLFPMSRKCFPKQFLQIAGKKSLLAQTIERFLGKVEPKDIVIVSNEAYQFYVKDILVEEGAQEASIILEPSGRNTAPAIALACQYCKEKLQAADDEVVFVAPSDHIVEPKEQFIKLVNRAEEIAASGKIVTLGVIPDKPETGYGYINAGEGLSVGGYKVSAFKEKPTKAVAESYLKAGNYFWNAGMFVFSIKTMENELSTYNPEIINITKQGFDSAANNFASMPDISIDYAVAEKSEKMAVLPFNIYWNDIGSWDALCETLDTDESDNAINGDVELLDCDNTMAISNSRMVVGIGLKDLSIVETPDVILVTKKGDSQKVKKVFEKLQLAERKETAENITMFRPWGSYTILTEGEGFKVKRIVVKPGGRLSLQLHHHRSEHWTVVSGEATITNGSEVTVCKANEGVYIPIENKHRLENLTTEDVVIIEVQVGKYLGEDDIERFDDVYGR